MSFDVLEQVEAGLVKKRVGIIEFAESDDYCNKRLYPRQRLLLKLIFLEELTPREEDILNFWIAGGRNGTEVQISPGIRERIEYLRNLGAPHFREIIFCGGRRSSKGFVTGIAMAKVMYDALLLQDPGTYYNIDSEKEIYFSCVASAEAQAKKFQYADLVSTVETCGAFEPYLAKSLETEFGIMTPSDQRKLDAAKAKNRKVQRHIAKLRGNALASNASTLRGSATMALCIDEMAHMVAGESRASAEQVYDAAVPALDQFGMDAIIFGNSSPYTKVGKFYERWVEAMKIKENGEPTSPLMFAIQFPSWTLYDGYWEKDPAYPHVQKHKKAITVSADWEPDEINPDTGKLMYSPSDRAQINIARQEEAQNPEKYKVERRGKFAEVVDAYLQPEAVDRMFQGRPWLEAGEKEYRVLKTNYGVGATYLHRYVAHLDPSSTTAGFGFALGHIEELPDLQNQMTDHVVFDIVKRWQPQNFVGGVINWEIVIDEIERYAVQFRPEQITFDQFQSHAPIQDLNQRLQKQGVGGVRVFEKFATNEVNWKRAEVFKTALYLDLIHAPSDIDDDEWASLELKFLQQINTAGKFPRVDKQDVGPVTTKDMADCMMTVVEYFIGNQVANRVRGQLSEGLAAGAPGGFGIGGGDRATPQELAGYYNRRGGEQRSFPTTPADRMGQAITRGRKIRRF